MYKILGSDGNEYGPLSADKIKRWIAEERVEKKTPVLPEGAEDWVFLSSLPEFADALAAQEPEAVRKKRRIAVGVGLFLLVVIGVAVLWYLKHAKHH